MRTFVVGKMPEVSLDELKEYLGVGTQTAQRVANMYKLSLSPQPTRYEMLTGSREEEEGENLKGWDRFRGNCPKGPNKHPGVCPIPSCFHFGSCNKGRTGEEGKSK